MTMDARLRRFGFTFSVIVGAVLLVISTAFFVGLVALFFYLFNGLTVWGIGLFLAVATVTALNFREASGVLKGEFWRVLPWALSALLALGLGPMVDLALPPEVRFHINPGEPGASISAASSAIMLTRLKRGAAKRRV